MRKIPINICKMFLQQYVDHSCRDTEGCSVSYLLSCNKLLQHVVTSNNTELGCDLAGSSALGLLQGAIQVSAGAAVSSEGSNGEDPLPK